jgi:hypothetical protein
MEPIAKPALGCGFEKLPFLIKKYDFFVSQAVWALLDFEIGTACYAGLAMTKKVSVTF